jgi:formate hydrogenlyase subunit 6/NADH:ubiquinone oxidoreductase subunit I
LIDKGLCTGCGHCVPFCPEEAISVLGIAEIDSEKCRACSLCQDYCPNSAIVEGPD